MTGEKNLTTFYIVRHGQTVWNTEGKLQGHKDSPLTEKGILQAREMGAFLKKIKFDAVFSSDLLRAKRTAEIIALEKKLMVQTTEALRERNFGKYEGQSWSEENNELKKLFDKYDNLSHAEKLTYFNEEVETDNVMMARIITFLREIAVAYIGKTILLVSHGGIMCTLLVHLGYGTYDELHPGSVKNTAYIKLESDGVDFFVKETKGVEKNSK